MARKPISGKGAKAKGTRGETEFVDILTELGVPSQRVIASGAIKGAEGDVKVGVRLKPDGTMPEKDESFPLLRAEVKNRASHPDWIFTELEKSAVEVPFKDLEQSKATSLLAWRRSKIPTGALVGKRYNEIWLCIMGIEDFAIMAKKLTLLEEENNELRSAIKQLRKENTRND